MYDVCGIVLTFFVGLHAKEKTWEAYMLLGRRSQHHYVRQRIRKRIIETICNTTFSSLKNNACRLRNLHSVASTKDTTLIGRISEVVRPEREPDFVALKE